MIGPKVFILHKFHYIVLYSHHQSSCDLTWCMLSGNNEGGWQLVKRFFLYENVSSDSGRLKIATRMQLMWVVYSICYLLQWHRKLLRIGGGGYYKFQDTVSMTKLCIPMDWQPKLEALSPLLPVSYVYVLSFNTTFIC